MTATTRPPGVSRGALPTVPRLPLRAGMVKRCPSCRTPLDGGPIRFRCDPCGRPFTAADLDTEYHPAEPCAPHMRRSGALGSAPARTVPDGRNAG